MILPEWSFITVICLLIFLLANFLIKLGKEDNDLKLEDFLMSRDPGSGKMRANPHKLVFLLSFVICAWINIAIAPMIGTSVYALYYSLAFMGVFTISLLSKTALTTIRDIVVVWVTRQAPPAPNHHSGGKGDSDKIES